MHSPEIRRFQMADMPPVDGQLHPISRRLESVLKQEKHRGPSQFPQDDPIFPPRGSGGFEHLLRLLVEKLGPASVWRSAPGLSTFHPDIPALQFVEPCGVRMSANARLARRIHARKPWKTFSTEATDPVMKIDPPSFEQRQRPSEPQTACRAHSGPNSASKCCSVISPSLTAFAPCQPLAEQDVDLALFPLDCIEQAVRGRRDWPRRRATPVTFPANQLDGPHRAPPCPPAHDEKHRRLLQRTAWRSPSAHAARSTRDDCKLYPSSFPIITPLR